MSINSAMLAGVSGLKANASALAAISDNIANVNTIGYKRNQVDFTNIVTSQAVATGYSAAGVQGAVRQYVSQQGLVQATTSSTDFALTGDGFFVTSDKPTGSDGRVFTRAGSFSPDAAGYLKNTADLYLQGWPIQANGTFDTSPSDVSKLQAINIKNQGGAVTPTSTIQVTANLNKDPADVTPVPIELKVIDAAGGSHTLQLIATKVPATPGEWSVAIATVPASDTSAFPAGKLVFTPDGAIDLAASHLGGALGTNSITIGASAGGTAPAWSVPQDLPAQTFSIDLSKISQLNDSSGVTTVSQDGAVPGSVVGVSVDKDGIVSAIYDNNQVRQIYKLAVATFPNSDGLQAISGNAYQATLDSGQFVLKEAGENGAGKVSGGSLETSTVDLSSEFTGLIATQKAYSASSKIITTADQMLDELINIIR